MGTWALARPVWHCSMRAAPQDKMLSDDEWAQIACDVMHRTGLAPFGQEDDAVRWVALRHGDDHIHLVAMLARQDGRRPRMGNDRYRVRDACLAAEQRYGLQRTAPGDRTAACRPSRAESEKAGRRGLQEAPRLTLRRHVSTAAAAAASEQEFFTGLRRSGVLVRTRSSTRNPGEVTGYAVALPGDTSKTGNPVWYGGGKLAADLTLPKLRRRWAEPGDSAADRFTAAERSAVWDHAARVADRASAHIQALAATNSVEAADAAWATADTLHAAAAALGSRILRQAADAYDRAARAPYGRIPAPTPAGDSLRRAARLPSAYGYLTSDPSFRPIVLITRLAMLAEAIAALRQTQERAAQAASAPPAAVQPAANVLSTNVLSTNVLSTSVQPASVLPAASADAALPASSSSTSSATQPPMRVECTPASRASELTGKHGCVAGRVFRVTTTKRGDTHLSLCPGRSRGGATCSFHVVAKARDSGDFGSRGYKLPAHRAICHRAAASWALSHSGWGPCRSYSL